MRFSVWLAALVWIAPSSALAADWWFVGGSDNFNAYVDRETIRSPAKDVVTAWIYTYNAEEGEGGEWSARAMNAFHCQQRTFALLSRTNYDATGRVLGSSTMETVEENPVGPGTVAEEILEFVCGRSQGIAASVGDPAAHARAAFANAEGSPAQSGAEEAGGLATGTGFFVSASGLLMTSYHVVEGASRIACRTPAGRIHNASFVRGSQANDVALLRVDTRPAQYLGFAPAGTVREGDRVFTIGFPAVSMLGLEPRFTDGTVSALSVGGENAFLQTSIPIQPGNSGGPVVTERGQVVGIIAATAAVEPFYRETGSLPQNVNWAIKAEYATPLLGATAPAPVRTREEAIAQVRASVCLIVAER